MSTYYGGSEQLQPMGQGPVPARKKGRTVAIVAGVGAAGVAIAGVAVGATMFFSAGSQPAEALPDSTIAYVGVDLNPSGAQKVEAIKLLRKFPAFTDQVDINEDSDLIEEFFNEAIANGECGDLDYAKDVKPWLGARAAMAAVDAGGDQPSPVAVVQVQDEKKAEAGIEHLVEVCGGDAGAAGIAVNGEWALFAQTQEVADDVAGMAGKASLADDATFKKWTDEAGGDAIISAYVSPRIADYAEDLAALGGGVPMPLTGEPSVYSEDPSAFDDELASPSADPEAIKEALSKFEGAAAAIRFDNAGLEIEFAAGVEGSGGDIGAATAGDLVGNLPASTVAALGVGLDEDWLTKIETEMGKLEGGEDLDIDSLLADSGVTRDDLTALLGKGFALAVGSGVDPDALTNGGIEEVPAAVVVDTEVESMKSALANVLAATGADTTELDWLQPEGSDGHAVISPNDDFRAEVVDPGEKLSGTKEYKDVLEDLDDAQGLFFVNFNADDEWIVRLLESEAPDAAENVAPLAAFGVVGWFDDGVSHLKLRLTTD